MIDWNDLRYFLAVAKSGSTLAAARVLTTSQSTVQRRIAELERRIGQRLVQRHPTGCRLTDVGAELLPLAAGVEAAVRGFERRAASSRNDGVSTIRITCPEPAGHLISRSKLIETFHRIHPAFHVEIVMSDKFLDLAKGEADIAIRSGEASDDNLWGRKIADAIWAVYASKEYIEEHGAPRLISDIEDHCIVSFDDAMAHHRVAHWLRQVAPRARIAARNDSVLGLFYAVKSGAGIAPLPVALAEPEPDLVRVIGPVPELTSSWWLLTRPESRHTVRIASFFDFARSEMDTLRAILTGGIDPRLLEVPFATRRGSRSKSGAPRCPAQGVGLQPVMPKTSPVT